MKILTKQDLMELYDDNDNGRTSKEIKDLYKNKIEEMNKLKKIHENLKLNKVSFLSNHDKAYKNVENVLNLKDRLILLKLLQNNNNNNLLFTLKYYKYKYNYK